MSGVALIYHAAVFGILLFALFMVLANLACFDGLREVERPSPESPLVSILVPARNEAHNIQRCVSSLLAQTYPFCEVIVLDDHSTDGTASVLQGLGVSETGSVARLIRGRPLPEGWTGKNWACHQLAGQARGVYLFFTDADTHHASGTVAALVEYAQRRRADLVSAWPRQVTESWSEKLVLPMILLLAFTFYPHWLMTLLQRFPRGAARLPRRIRRFLGGANGQALFFRRAAYERIGGHAAVRSHVVEDVALGREVAAHVGEGMRLFNCDALRFSTVRMYRSFAEIWEGYSKNLRAIFESSLSGFLTAGAVQLCCFLLPCLALLLGFRSAWLPASVALIYLIRTVLTVRFRTSWVSCVFHPIGQALALLIGLNSWRLAATRGVTWKGRTYAVLPVQLQKDHQQIDYK